MEMRLKAYLQDHYSECFDSIKEITKDDTAQPPYLTERLEKAINFDGKLVEKFYKPSPKAVDMIDIQNSGINIIEFKNRPINSKLKEDLKLKGVETILILYEIMKKHGIIEKFCEVFSLKINYYIIFFPEKNRNANRERFPKIDIEFGLKKYEKKYFNKVEIMFMEQFEKEYIDKYLVIE